MLQHKPLVLWRPDDLQGEPKRPDIRRHPLLLRRIFQRLFDKWPHAIGNLLQEAGMRLCPFTLSNCGNLEFQTTPL